MTGDPVAKEGDVHDEFAAALGGEIGGHVEGNKWSCTCGAEGEEFTEQAASLALYFHRKSGHQEVTVL